MASQTTLLHLKRHNKPSLRFFVPLYTFGFQRQPFRFLFQFAIEPFALFHHSIFDSMYLTVMFHR